MPSNLQYQEIYTIADFQHHYLSLLVCVYQNSQFYILFNQREYFVSEEDSSKFNSRQCRKLLQKLVKKAEKELSIKIVELSYNLPCDQLKIFKHSYIHQFSSSVKIGVPELKKIHQGFLTMSNKDKDYENCLFKITNYHLIDQNKKQKNAPFEEIVESIKVEGYLYQIH
ncbi:MAG: hypothetical protein QJQ54_02220 [Mollicutes bacterium]|nr:MAG: hypothetical protein QJQ54_02220 [Mollicutes bacterium]